MWKGSFFWCASGPRGDLASLCLMLKGQRKRERGRKERRKGPFSLVRGRRYVLYRVQYSRINAVYTVLCVLQYYMPNEVSRMHVLSVIV